MALVPICGKTNGLIPGNDRVEMMSKWSLCHCHLYSSVPGKAMCNAMLLIASGMQACSQCIGKRSNDGNRSFPSAVQRQPRSLDRIPRKNILTHFRGSSPSECLRTGHVNFTGPHFSNYHNVTMLLETEKWFHTNCNWLTDSMEQSPSWEANSRSDNQESLSSRS